MNFCTFCDIEAETVPHLFCTCLKVKPLWHYIENLTGCDISMENIIFNSVKTNPKHAENCLVLATKYYI